MDWDPFWISIFGTAIFKTKVEIAVTKHSQDSLLKNVRKSQLRKKQAKATISSAESRFHYVNWTQKSAHEARCEKARVVFSWTRGVKAKKPPRILIEIIECI